MCRGDRREPIFEDNGDRVMFQETIGECCERSGWKIYAWVLMSNHYHWVVQAPQANLVSGMKMVSERLHAAAEQPTQEVGACL
jgi:putative transposase